MMPITASTRMIVRTVGFIAAPGKSGTREAQEAERAQLEHDAARTTEPAVGASTCASGSQVWNGNIGTFTANARKNAPKQPERRRRRDARRSCRIES